MTQKKTVWFCEIAGTSGTAGYSKKVTKDATDQNPKDIIEKYAKQDVLPEGDYLKDITPNLDLDLADTEGTVIIALRLPKLISVASSKMSKESDLVFMPTPVRELASNFDKSETYIKDVETYKVGLGRWASFECDLDWIRKKSEIVKKIKGMHKEKNGIAHDNLTHLRIPFLLSVKDKNLGFAPWMLPPELPTATGPATSASMKSSAKIMTHGGVHPQFASYLIVDI